MPPPVHPLSYVSPHKEEAENTNKTGENANKEAEAVKPKGENEMNFASQVKK